GSVSTQKEHVLEGFNDLIRICTIKISFGYFAKPHSSPAMGSCHQDEEFMETYQLFDTKGDGKVQVNQVGDLLRALGQNPTEGDIQKLTQQHKPEDRITLETFIPIYYAISNNKTRSHTTADDFIEGLRQFDVEGNGYFSSVELRHLLTSLGEKMTDEEVEQLLVGQEDAQGNIHYEELVRVVLNG
ncbi:unnamed protein product, partial [Allacma fusca]